MKKFFVALMLMVLMVSFSGCKDVGVSTNNKIQVVATIFPLYDFARAVAGDKVDVNLLMPCGADSHSYEPTVQDVMMVQESELFILLGKGAESWADGIVSTLEDKKVLFAMEQVELNEHHHEEHSMFEYDQHIWTSLKNSKEIVLTIADALSEIDAQNEQYYKDNAEAYVKELDALDVKFKELTKNTHKPLVFADRFPFEYFTHDYNLEHFAAFPGCSEESEPSASSVTELINIIEKEDVEVVFYTETSNGKLPDTICSDTGVTKKLLHSCHTVTKEEFDSGITYLDLMSENYKSLEFYLK